MYGAVPHVEGVPPVNLVSRERAEALGDEGRPRTIGGGLVRCGTASVVGLAGVAAVALGYLGAASPPSGAAPPLAGLASSDDASTPAPVLSVSNDYERDVLGHHIADGLWWDHLVQRYRPTAIEIETECEAAWTVLNPDGTTEATYEGASFEAAFSQLGMHTLELTLDCDGTDSPDASFE